MTRPALIDVEDLFVDPEFSGASISPDGTRIAYLAPAHGRANVWIRGIDEAHADAVCVTHDSRRGIGSYYWTDDPRWLLYVQDTDGNEDWHLFRVDLEAPDEPAVDLTPMDPGSRVMGAEPLGGVPGTFLVSMNRRPLHVDTFRIDIASGETTVHHENDDPTAVVVVGPAGEVIVRSQSEGGDLEYWATDETTGESRLVHRLDGPAHPVGVHPEQFTADGTGLLLGCHHESDDLRLIRVDIASGEVSVVAALEGRDLCISSYVAQGGPPTLFTSRRTGAVLAARFVGDRPVVHVVDPDFQPIFDVLSTLSDGVLGGLSSDEDERLWVATFAHDTDPGVTYLYDHVTGESRLLGRPYPDRDPKTLAPMTGVTFNARDGLPLHAFLTVPVGIDPVGLPLVLVVHGGPWFNDVWGFNPGVQFLANRGYAVLQLNFRGSTGYGRHHLTAAIGEFAGTMHHDLIDAGDWAVAQGIADPSRIGIYGASYGGYSALVGVTVTPDYFAASVDNCGISSMPDFMRSLPPFLRPTLTNNWYRYVGDPDDPEQEADMLTRSPITMVDRIRTPLLVVQGANDPRVVQAEADNIVEALTTRGVPVEYLLAADEGHGFRNRENVITLWRAVERHFGEHLGPRTTSSAGAHITG